VCRHRDLSVCGACATTHAAEITFVFNAYFAVPPEVFAQERQANASAS
jgi:hypothetical protein